MIEVDEALRIVLAHARPLAAGPAVPTLGRVLAEDVAADLDSPPFAKALMDGYAVRSTDLRDGHGSFAVVGEVAAGSLPTLAVTPGTATRIFTGAKLPAGADAVVKQELAVTSADGRVTLTDPSAKPGRNVMERGREMRAGEVVLSAGTVLTPAALGVCATLGRAAVLMIPAANVAIVTTGDELVGAGVTPAGAQIRDSNGPMLAGLVQRAGATPRRLGPARDDEAALTAMLRDALATAEVVLVVGGVSVGAFDLVPQVLASLGVTAHFHKVRMKPGKPLLFGTQGDKLVFGLPGNPVSAFVGFELFVRPALRALAGLPPAWHPPTTGTLAADFAAGNDRPTFHPVKLSGSSVLPLPWFGSADLRALLAADALMRLPAGNVALRAGDPVPLVLI